MAQAALQVGHRAAEARPCASFGTLRPQQRRESLALERVVGAGGHTFAVSSTKSMHGHTLGAAGALEGVVTALAVYHDVMPPTINYEFPDPECTLDYVPNVARKAKVEIALSNSFGFGGHNGVLVFGKYKD